MGAPYRYLRGICSGRGRLSTPYPAALSASGVGEPFSRFLPIMRREARWQKILSGLGNNPVTTNHISRQAHCQPAMSLGKEKAMYDYSDYYDYYDYSSTPAFNPLRLMILTGIWQKSMGGTSFRRGYFRLRGAEQTRSGCLAARGAQGVWGV